MLLIDGVGSATFFMMSFLSNSAIFCHTSRCVLYWWVWVDNETVESPLCLRPSKTSLYSVKTYSLVKGALDFTDSEATVFTCAVSEMVSFNSHSFSQVSADSRGFFVVSTTWKSNSLVVLFSCIFRLATTQGFMREPSNSLSGSFCLRRPSHGAPSHRKWRRCLTNIVTRWSMTLLSLRRLPLR